MRSIKIGIQKGKLEVDSFNYLTYCGFSFPENIKKELRIKSTNSEIELFLLRGNDITKFINDGTLDVAIIGENTLKECTPSETNAIKKLGFGKCRLSLAIPSIMESEYNGLNYFNNKIIATSYPMILNKFFKEKKIKFKKIIEISGSVELAPALKIADCIFDVVESGKTLLRNNLSEIFVVMESEAVLVDNSNLFRNNLESIKNLNLLCTQRGVLINKP